LSYRPTSGYDTRGSPPAIYGEQGVNVDETTTTPRRWTAAELRKLPAHERDAIMEAAAAAAEEEYRTNPELTAFEAFGKDDLYGESSSAETR
jgi:hypothetical protein